MERNVWLVMQVQSGKARYMEDLWAENERLISYVAARYRGGCGRHYDDDDLMQAGYIGLHAAAMTYSVERGASFSTYAVFHIRRAMREAAGLRGKRDPLLDASPLDAPVFDDGDQTLLDQLPVSQEECPVEQAEYVRIMRMAVERIRDDKARDAIQAVYWEGMTVVDYAKAREITKQAAHDRLNHGYAILRRDRSVVSLAIVEGITSPIRSSNPESYTLARDERDRRQRGLYAHLGHLMSRKFGDFFSTPEDDSSTTGADQAHRREALRSQLGDLVTVRSGPASPHS